MFRIEPHAATTLALSLLEFRSTKSVLAKVRLNRARFTSLRIDVVELSRAADADMLNFHLTDKVRLCPHEITEVKCGLLDTQLAAHGGHFNCTNFEFEHLMGLIWEPYQLVEINIVFCPCFFSASEGDD